MKQYIIFGLLCFFTFSVQSQTTQPRSFLLSSVSYGCYENEKFQSGFAYGLKYNQNLFGSFGLIAGYSHRSTSENNEMLCFTFCGLGSGRDIVGTIPATSHSYKLGLSYSMPLFEKHALLFGGGAMRNSIDFEYEFYDFHQMGAFTSVDYMYQIYHKIILGGHFNVEKTTGVYLTGGLTLGIGI